MKPMQNDFADLKVSFEFFPPKTDAGDIQLLATALRLGKLAPKFMTVTYGAGGSTRAKTHAMAVKIQDQARIPVAAHLTCVNASRAEIHDISDELWDDGIRHIVALRGDMPGGVPYVPHPDGYDYTSHLIEGLKKRHDFEISCAAYPEKHPDAPSLDIDIDNLKKKVDAGADRVITQFFFEPATYLRFLEKAEARGIKAPIVPGILPVNNFAQVEKFSKQCGANIPDYLIDRFASLNDDPDILKLMAAVTAAEQCQALYAYGIRHFHFYTMNKADLVYAVCHLLGLRAHAHAANPTFNPILSAHVGN